MVRRSLVVTAVTAVLALSPAGTASTSTAYGAAADSPAARQCTSELGDTFVLAGAAALAGFGSGGPPGALGGALGGLIVGGVKTAECLGN